MSKSTPKKKALNPLFIILALDTIATGLLVLDYLEIQRTSEMHYGWVWKAVVIALITPLFLVQWVLAKNKAPRK